MLNLEYLLEISPGPPSPPFVPFHLALAVLLVVGLLTRPRESPSRSPALSKLTTFLLALGAGLVGARILGIPYLSIRLLVYGISGTALLAWGRDLFALAHQRGWIERQLRILTLSWAGPQAPLPLPALSLLLAAHGLGLALLAAHFQRSYAWTLLLWVGLAAPLILASFWKRKPLLYEEAFTPLFFGYLVVGLSRITSKALPLLGPQTVGAAPSLLSGALSVEAALLASAAYSVFLQVYVLCALYSQRPVERAGRAAGIILLALALTWAAAEYSVHVTQGVTASDPYAYAQMAIDLVKRGTPLHRFDLFPEISELDIPWWPVVHVGYHLPLNKEGDAATVWPFGGSIWLAIGYLVGGEQGLYWTTPLMALLSALVLFALIYELWSDGSPGARVWAGAWGATLLLTSFEQIDRSLVPMVDASAQLFTTATILFALKGMRGRPRTYGLLAGLAWGTAYFVRHTQLVMGMSVLMVVLLMGRHRPWREKIEFMFPFGLAAFLIALSDLAYHQLVFGSVLALESEELKHYSLANIPAVSRTLMEQLFARSEFGYLLPLLMVGVYSMAQRATRELGVLLSWVLLLLAAHLPYEALRLRDLLSLFPVLIVLAVEGIIALWQFGIQAGRNRASLALVMIFLVFWMPALRTQATLAKPLDVQVTSFGWMSAPERKAFDRLAELTPPGSVIGTSLNSGPIDFYAGRAAFRPAFWSDGEIDVFVRAMWGRGRQVYILDDSSDTAQVLDRTRDRYRLMPIAELGVPLFGDPERASRRLYRLEAY